MTWASHVPKTTFLEFYTTGSNRYCWTTLVRHGTRERQTLLNGQGLGGTSRADSGDQVRGS